MRFFAGQWPCESLGIAIVGTDTDRRSAPFPGSRAEEILAVENGTARQSRVDESMRGMKEKG
ncbi:hypothetical protein GN958_ATG06548 [Phytophthora infestans]|uniref:Uncharacterized protein n=1 Tax=Phytophthora infestans TaxID=4787 RepID=A0A8S9UWV8_PHYIN|nr:hypothetical protein GN958_ATG06548 [Phytophthora infestans]